MRPATTPFAAVLAGAILLPQHGHAVGAVGLNLATVSCAKYENEVLTSSIPGYGADPIDTVMWLFGFATAKAGDRVMYGDSLRAFGFALDGQCKATPTSSLLDAVTSVTSKRENPMDLTRLDCATFGTRHENLRTTDPENARTVTMWMFGFAVGVSGGHLLDPGALEKFEAALQAHCRDHPQDTVFDALRAPNPAVPRTLTSRSAQPQPAAPAPAAPKH